MQRICYLLLCLLLLATPVLSQLGRCGPVPWDQWPANQPPTTLAPPDDSRPLAARDALQLKRDARDLAELSASLPADLDRLNRGLLPKDLVEKLKRVEKLSKRLRGLLAP